MRRIEYKLQLDMEPFTIACCNMDRPYSEAKECQPIKLFVTHSTEENDIAAFLSAVDMKSIQTEDFAKNCSNILFGMDPQWRLMSFQIEAGCAILEYYNDEKDFVEEISINLEAPSLESLLLRLLVPHADGRPDTEYTAWMKYNKPTPRRERYSDTILTEYIPAQYKRTLFMFCSDKPYEVSVTEYVDL